MSTVEWIGMTAAEISPHAGDGYRRYPFAAVLKTVDASGGQPMVEAVTWLHENMRGTYIFDWRYEAIFFKTEEDRMMFFLGVA